MSLNGEKLLKREKPRELIFPSNYDLLRHLQYATHFPIPLVSHASISVYHDDFFIWSLVIGYQIIHPLICLHMMSGENLHCCFDAYNLDHMACVHI